MNYNKGFLASLMIIGLISAMAGYGTLAFFSDVESAEDNTLQAGTIDIAIDNENPWMSSFTLEDMKPSEMYQQWTNVTIKNVGTNDAIVCKMINITGYGGGLHPESELAEDPENEINKISAAIEYWNHVEIYDANETLVEQKDILMGHLLLGVDEEEYKLGVIPGDGGYAVVTQRYHMFNETTNWAQGDNMTFDMHFYAQQVNDPEECGDCSGVETIYLSDSGPGGEGAEDGTTIFEVVLDDSEQRAYLNKMFEVDSGAWDNVDSLSSSNDGKELYLWDKNTDQLGTYDLVTETFDNGVDYSGTPVAEKQIVLGAVNPEDGLIYGASDDTDEIVTIDPNSPSGSVLGTVSIVEGGTLDVQGADLIFDAYGDLILYTNADDAFYNIDLDTMTATLATEPSPAPDYFTGIAIREAGTGALVGSTNGFETSGNIYVVDRDTGDAVAYEPYFGMTPHTVGYGDMAVGVICPDPDSVIEPDEEQQ